MSILNEGDEVNIYEYPVTEENLEGVAVLMEKQSFKGVHEGRILESWLIDFTEVMHSTPRYRNVMEPRLDNQKAFDIAATHLLKQGKICEADGRMMLRCGSLRSALGALIPDELYHLEMDLMDDSDDVEGMSVTALLLEFQALKERFSGVTLDLLDDLESVHDMGKGIEHHWKLRLHSVAKKFGLNPMILTQGGRA